MSDPKASDSDLFKSTQGQVRIFSGQELWQWQQKARQQALAAAIPIAEVAWLLREVVGLDTLALRLETYKDQPQIQSKLTLEELDKLWHRRIADRVPLQYLVKVAPWRQFSLAVSPAVLIPRPETENLIELAIAAVQQSPQAEFLQRGDWADLGTGSGAIALGLAEVFPSARIHAVDRSTEALAIAQHNCDQYGLTDQIQFYQGSWFEPLLHLRGQLSGMVSNPPYIPSLLVPKLQPEVAHHEPHLALDGGPDGLDCIRHLVETAPQYLISGGIWLVEIMAGQAEAVTVLLQNQGSYQDVSIHYDLAGLERFVMACRS